MQVFCTAPAIFRRAFFIGGWFLSVVVVVAAPTGQSPPPLTQLGGHDPAEGRAALEQVRRQGIAGNYFLEFQLRVMPRRGEERLIPGRLWGSRNQTGALTRVSLTLPGSSATAGERRLLIQNGRASAVWRWDTGGDVQMLGAASPFESVVPNTELTAFDLQMPFIYWDDFAYEGLTRFHGRPAHVLIMRPPADFRAKYPTLTGVRIHLDTQFNALVQTELLGANNAVLKTLSLVDLKKVKAQWIPRTFDVRDETSRNKTRFDVVAVGLDLDFSRTLFEPAQLADDIRAPGGAQLVRLAP
jgi:hypothetical protein